MFHVKHSGDLNRSITATFAADHRWLTLGRHRFSRSHTRPTQSHPRLGRGEREKASPLPDQLRTLPAPSHTSRASIATPHRPQPSPIGSRKSAPDTATPDQTIWSGVMMAIRCAKWRRPYRHDIYVRYDSAVRISGAGWRMQMADSSCQTARRPTPAESRSKADPP